MAIGDKIRPELGRYDYGQFLQGSAAGSQALGQGLQTLGAGAGKFLEDRGEARKTTKAGTTKVQNFMKLFPENQQVQNMGQTFLANLEDANLADAAAMAGQADSLISTFLDKTMMDMQKGMFDRKMEVELAKGRLDAFLGKDLREAQTAKLKAETDVLKAPQPAEPSEAEVYRQREEGKAIAEWEMKGRQASEFNANKLEKVIQQLYNGLAQEKGEPLPYPDVPALQTGPYWAAYRGSVGFMTAAKQIAKNAQKDANAVDYQSLSDLFPGPISNEERERVETLNFDASSYTGDNIKRLEEKVQFIRDKSEAMDALVAGEKATPSAKPRKAPTQAPQTLFETLRQYYQRQQPTGQALGSPVPPDPVRNYLQQPDSSKKNE